MRPMLLWIMLSYLLSMGPLHAGVQRLELSSAAGMSSGSEQLSSGRGCEQSSSGSGCEQSSSGSGCEQSSSGSGCEQLPSGSGCDAMSFGDDATVPAIQGGEHYAQGQPKPAHHVLLGEGDQLYQWVHGWGVLPEGMTFGNTHGCIVIDAQDNVYMNTDTDNAVIVFDKDGKFLRSFGKEWRGGLHGMTLRKEGDKEFIYFVHTERHVAAKMTLDGEVLWTLRYPTKPGIYTTEAEYHPTSIAIAPNGDIFVADGYGKSWVHQFNEKREYIRSFGGPGDGPAQMASPHGIWMDTRGEKPVLLVADREHHRIQQFDLDGKLIGLIKGDLRRPSNFGQRGTDIAVADLEGRVTILDKDNKVVTHLGDNTDPAKRANNGVPPDQWADGQFIAPHCARWDSEGNLYVLDWVSSGRITKLKHVKLP